MNGAIDDVVLNFSPTSLLILNAVLAVVMFSIALDLSPADFGRLRRAPKPLLIGLLSQFVVLPVLTFIMVWLLNPKPSIALGLILVAACPGGNISNFITHRAGGNTALSVSMTGIATVAAILMTPFNIAFWGGLYPPTHAILHETSLDPMRIAVTVCFMLVLPLVLGVLCNRYLPALAAKMRKPLQWLAMAIFIAFIVLALAANWSYFLQFAGAVAGLVILHNALAMAGGWGTATLARLSPYDRRAVMIETGIQNSGLGLVLIFAFFSGLGGMAVTAAFWGIWHAVSGLALAMILSRTEAAR
ncbi:MAG: bile acid:sodium symporter family protein [Alphaproteobacteria bacterium]|nr:MAG: bile acid:sodium symporter family protein [Alphaproteobacteria bacterium]